MRTRHRLLLAGLVAALVVVLVAPGSGAAGLRKKPFTVTITQSATYAVQGSAVTLIGKVRPRSAGKKVYLERRVGEDSWQRVASVRLTKKSGYTFTWPAQGTAQLRVTKPAGAGHRAGSSVYVVVIGVVPPPAG